jgi:hypothetical protein
LELKAQVSISNPSRVKAFGQSELHEDRPTRRSIQWSLLWVHQPDRLLRQAHLREMRELIRRCLKAAQVQELNRQQAGMA